MTSTEPGTRHYCHACGWWADRPDGVFCGYCLTYFRRHGRLPRASDAPMTRGAMADAYAAMGWPLPNGSAR